MATQIIKIGPILINLGNMTYAELTPSGGMWIYFNVTRSGDESDENVPDGQWLNKDNADMFMRALDRLGYYNAT